MKRMMISTLLTTVAALSMDFSQMSTQELINMRGTLSAAERPAFRAEMQKRMPTMSPEERQLFMQRRNQSMGKGMMGQRGGMGRGQKGMQNRPTFTSYDLNHDGKVTNKEFYDAQASRMSQKAAEGRMMKNAGKAPTFESIDTNKDGVITQDEFTKHQINRMNQNRRGNGMGQGKGFKRNQLN